MTTHWIISIGGPNLAVMSGKAMLTALSSGTTDVPRPISTSRSPCRAVIPGRAATPVFGVASAGTCGAVFMAPIVAEVPCSECPLREKIFAQDSSWAKMSALSDAYEKVRTVL